MAKEELKRFRHSIALLVPSIVESEYRSALEKVRLRSLPASSPDAGFGFSLAAVVAVSTASVIVGSTLSEHRELAS